MERLLSAIGDRRVLVALAVAIGVIASLMVGRWAMADGGGPAGDLPIVDITSTTTAEPAGGGVADLPSRRTRRRRRRHEARRRPRPRRRRRPRDRAFRRDDHRRHP